MKDTIDKKKTGRPQSVWDERSVARLWSSYNNLKSLYSDTQISRKIFESKQLGSSKTIAQIAGKISNIKTKGYIGDTIIIDSNSPLKSQDPPIITSQDPPIIESLESPIIPTSQDPPIITASQDPPIKNNENNKKRNSTQDPPIIPSQDPPLIVSQYPPIVNENKKRKSASDTTIISKSTIQPQVAIAPSLQLPKPITSQDPPIINNENIKRKSISDTTIISKSDNINNGTISINNKLNKELHDKDEEIKRLKATCLQLSNENTRLARLSKGLNLSESTQIVSINAATIIRTNSESGGGDIYIIFPQYANGESTVEYIGVIDDRYHIEVRSKNNSFENKSNHYIRVFKDYQYPIQCIIKHNNKNCNGLLLKKKQSVPVFTLNDSCKS